MRRVILLLVLLLAVAGVSQAATEAQKQTAIDNGLAWLATQQQGNGRWEYGGETAYDTAATGAVLLAFMEEGHTATSGTLYSTNVQNGLNYLFTQATTYAISNEPAGNPDTFVNGQGIKFVTGGNNTRDTYATGLALAPIAKQAALTPNAPAALGRTYSQLVQDVVDYFAYGQADPGNWAQGGWRYYADYGQSDNSTSQWPVIGLLYAQAAGATVPQFVKDQLRVWVNYIQNPADGGSYYDNNFTSWYSNVSRTGGWLMESAFIGTDASLVTPADVTAALNYLNNQWQSTANSTWNGNFGHPYAMWAAYKGLELTIGLGNTSTITNLHAFNSATMQLDAGDTWNWWEDYCEWLVDNQYGSGAWGGYSNWTGVLATAWDINILNATQVPQIPVPAAVVLGALGLSFAGWRLRRREEL